MSVFGPNARAAFDRATERAKAVLKAGDRVRVDGATVTFAYWSGAWGLPDPEGRAFSSRSKDDLSAWNIVAINGHPVSFRDDRGQRAVDDDLRMFRAVKVQKRRAAFRIVPNAPTTSETPYEA